MAMKVENVSPKVDPRQAEVDGVKNGLYVVKKRELFLFKHGLYVARK